MFEDVFSPGVVGYLTRQVDAALRRAAAVQSSPRERLTAELASARAALENVKQAILQGLLTPTTRELLETCERRVADVEAQLRTPRAPVKPLALASLVQTYLGDLRAALGTNVAYARTLLEKLVDKITPHQKGPDLVAEVRGNLVGILGEEVVCGFMVPGGGFVNWQPGPRFPS